MEQPRANETLRKVIVITPTYERITRRAELVRMVNTLRGLSHVLWIVVEDGNSTLDTMQQFLASSGVEFVYLFAPTRCMTPPEYVNRLVNCTRPPWSRMPRGINQRNAALDYIETHNLDGVIYFADDDNAYSWQLFVLLSHVKLLSVFPVGLIGALHGFEGPRVRADQMTQIETSLTLPQIVYDENGKNGKVIGWHETSVIKSRVYPIDMAGFAFGTSLLARSHARFRWMTRIGQLENDFLIELTHSVLIKRPGERPRINWSTIELLQASQDEAYVLVWHMRNPASAYTPKHYPISWSHSNASALVPHKRPP